MAATPPELSLEVGTPQEQLRDFFLFFSDYQQPADITWEQANEVVVRHQLADALCDYVRNNSTGSLAFPIGSSRLTTSMLHSNTSLMIPKGEVGPDAPQLHARIMIGESKLIVIGRNDADESYELNLDIDTDKPAISARINNVGVSDPWLCMDVARTASADIAAILSSKLAIEQANGVK